MRLLKILHVSQPTTEGVAKVVMQLAVAQASQGLHPAVASPAEGEIAEFCVAHNIIHYPWRAQRSPVRGTVSEVRRLNQILSLAQPDVIHLHSSKAGLSGRLAVRGRKPTIFQPHAWSFQASEPSRGIALRWEKFAARWTNLVITVSVEEAELGSSAAIDVTYETIPNGINSTGTVDMDVSRARRHLRLPDVPTITSIGRLTPQKDQRTLLQAFKIVRRGLPTARLYLVGDGPDETALRTFAPPGVHFVGSSINPRDWIRAANVVAVSSAYEAGLSLVTMEALDESRPVVSTRVAGSTAIAEANAGAVVAIGDAPALAAALLARLTNPLQAAAEGRAGRDLIRRDYTIDANSAILAEAYRATVRRAM